ncbi:MAG: DNA double-strand break repair nuclease NurA [Candidatus Helarchaeota archaeon]
MPRDIEEIYRQYEFNKTEPETLTGLIDSVIEKSDEIKYNFELYNELSQEAYQIFKNNHILHEYNIKEKDSIYQNFKCVGIDGSFQYVGGLGGLWYIPISCSRIEFNKGMKSNIIVIVAAYIETLNEMEYINVEKEASFRMLFGETKAIREWVSDNENSIIFLDGPVVDPPWSSSETDYKEYISNRTETLLKSIDKGHIIIGCVKRIMGRYYINHIKNNYELIDSEKNKINKFLSDAHLMSYILTRASINNQDSIIYSNPIKINTTDDTHKMYSDHGLDLYTFFAQKDFLSKPIRYDFCLKEGTEIDLLGYAKKISIISAQWTYPGQYSPLPVELAHIKCNIRRGCAEVLYNEIMTRTRSTNVFDNIIQLKMEEG